MAKGGDLPQVLVLADPCAFKGIPYASLHSWCANMQANVHADESYSYHAEGDCMRPTFMHHHIDFEGSGRDCITLSLLRQSTDFHLDCFAVS